MSKSRIQCTGSLAPRVLDVTAVVGTSGRRFLMTNVEEDRLIACLVDAAAKLGWDELATLPGLHRFMDHVRQGEG